MSHPGYIEQAALVSGWPAFAVARMLRRHWRDDVEDLPLHLRAPLEAYLADLERAGASWAASVRATAQPAAAQPEAESKETLTTKEVSELLDCTPQNVRKLVAAGRLPAQKGPGGWQVDAGAVHAHQEQRQGGVR